jgi:hypothetical protein
MTKAKASIFARSEKKNGKFGTTAVPVSSKGSLKRDIVIQQNEDGNKCIGFAISS